MSWQVSFPQTVEANTLEAVPRSLPRRGGRPRDRMRMIDRHRLCVRDCRSGSHGQSEVAAMVEQSTPLGDSGPAKPYWCLFAVLTALAAGHLAAQVFNQT